MVRHAGLLTLPRSSLVYAGYEFAMEAWKRVASVGATTINTHSANGDQQSLESLRLQKDAVKRELKLFDVHFTKFYGTVPCTQGIQLQDGACARASLRCDRNWRHLA
jgi:hypothetical protein